MGFFGLFGNKTKYVDEPNSVDESSKSESYYLSDDDAKSLGNPEFIRKSMKKKETTSSVNKNSANTTPSPKTNRSVDTNMDVFRKMAKDIKK